MPAARPDRPAAPAPGGSQAIRLPGTFEHFYLEEYPRVVKLAYALSGSRMTAEDIAQEAFLRAYRDWERVGSYEHQAAWVRRVAVNLASSGLRRRLVEARALARLAGTPGRSHERRRRRPRRRPGDRPQRHPGRPRGRPAAGLAVGAEGVWAYDQRRGAVLRIDPGTNRVARTIRVIDRPLVELYSRVLALGDGAVWVVDKGGGTVVRLDPYR